MEPILEEKQKFNQLFIWIPLVLLLFFLIINFYNNFSIINFIPLGILIIVIIFIVSITLKYSIDNEGIIISFTPFFKRKVLRKEDVKEISLVTYSPLLDFGGWGFRYGKNNTVAYNIKGNIGILITLKNNKKYLIGSQLNKTILLNKLNSFFGTIQEKKL